MLTREVVVSTPKSAIELEDDKAQAIAISSSKAPATKLVSMKYL